MANNLHKGINVVLKLGETVLGGQLGATLTQTAETIDITNKITGEWSEVLEGIKSWQITGNGLYIKNHKTYSLLQEAFSTNTAIDVEVMIDGHRYVGKALLIEFPLTAVYNNTYRYNYRLLGDGELSISE